MNIEIKENFENIEHLIVTLKIIVDGLNLGKMKGKFIKYEVFDDLGSSFAED